jgi:hypothetical protein
MVLYTSSNTDDSGMQEAMIVENVVKKGETRYAYRILVGKQTSCKMLT